jgi:plastocyanin
MRLRKRHLLPAAVLGLTAVMLPTIASSEPLPVAAVDEGIYYHHWSNSQQTIMAGEKVKFSNPYSESEPPHHGLKFTSGPGGAKPSCSGIPAAAESEAGAANWHGECTFSTSGTYTFICTVHPTEMKGTITVTNGEPTVTTEAAAPVTEHGATLKGTVNPNGKATEYFFKWGTTASYGHETSMQPAGGGTSGVSVFAMLSGLTPGTPYHFRLVAKNEKGTAEGADETFTTTLPPPPPGPPSATTGEAISVSETEATLKGTVNPDGKPTKSFFEWGTSESYGQVTTEVSAGEDHTSHVASAKLTGLVAGKSYHFRLVAKNASEEVQGVDQMFTTTSLSSPPSEPSLPTTTTPPPPPTTTTLAEPPLGPPIVGGPSLPASQHGSSVHGALDISQSGAGGRLEVDLLAKSASLAKTRHSSLVRVGRLVRASVSAGKVSFSVTLTAAGKRALTRKHRLPLTVKIALTPTRGMAVSITRSVTLRS